MLINGKNHKMMEHLNVLHAKETVSPVIKIQDSARLALLVSMRYKKIMEILDAKHHALNPDNIWDQTTNV